MRLGEPKNLDVRAAMHSAPLDWRIGYGRATSPQRPIRFKGLPSDTRHKLTYQPLSSVQRGQTQARRIGPRVLVPFLDRLMHLPIQVTSDRLPVNRLRLTLKQDSADRNPPAIEARDIHRPPLRVQAVPLEQPLVPEALPFDIEVMSEAQFKRCHLIFRLRGPFTLHCTALLTVPAPVT